MIPGRPAAAINRVVIEKGFDRQLILYWYQDRGRIVASEYAAKGYLILDATTRNRTDGALVRVSTPIVGSEEEAFRTRWRSCRRRFPALGEHLPGGLTCSGFDVRAARHLATARARRDVARVRAAPQRARTGC